MTNEQAREAARDAAWKQKAEFPDVHQGLHNYFCAGFDAGWDARGGHWVAERPDYACIFVGKNTFRGRDEYSVWQFAWTQGEAPEDFDGDDETLHYCLVWTDNDGDEYDDIEECKFSEYLVLAKLPTMDEVHAETVAQIRKRYEREFIEPYTEVK